MSAEIPRTERTERFEAIGRVRGQRLLEDLAHGLDEKYKGDPDTPLTREDFRYYLKGIQRILEEEIADLEAGVHRDMECLLPSAVTFCDACQQACYALAEEEK